MRLFKRKQAAPPWRTGPNSTFTRASTAMLNGVQFASGVPRIDGGKILIEEGTTNLLPAGAENFVTGWQNGTGETCTVTDYPVNIPDIGDVVAKRITGNGLGSSTSKYYLTPVTCTNPTFFSIYALCLSGNASLAGGSGITSTWSKATRLITVTGVYSFGFSVSAATNILDIVVYFPQKEAKPYATSYTPPGTTRAAESLAIPVGATQKNLLTQNQATGGDTLGNTTGFYVIGSTVTYDTDTKYQGAGSIKIVTSNSAANEGVYLAITGLTIGKIYTFSYRISGSGTLRPFYFATSDVYASNIEVIGSFAQYEFMIAATTASIAIGFRTASQQAATFWIDGLQLEESTTASDWALPVIDYSNAVLNPSAGTVEFDFIWNGNITTQATLFCVICPDGSYLNMFLRPDKYLIVYSNNGTLGSYSLGIITPNTKNTIKFRWSGVNMRGSLNGVLLANATAFKGFTKPDKLYFGLYSVHYPANSNFSNVRLSKIARSDTEMAYTGKLRADSYTTFFRKFWR